MSHLEHLRELRDDVEKEYEKLDEEIMGLMIEHEQLMDKLDELEDKQADINDKKGELEEEIRDLDEKIRNEEINQEMIEDCIYDELIDAGLDEMSAEIIAAEQAEGLI